MVDLIYSILAAIALLSAAFVAFSPNPVYAVISLVVTMLSLAGIFLVIQAPFVALIQVLVYAGAILVLFLYVIMLINPRRTDAPVELYLTQRGGALVALAAAVAIFMLLSGRWLWTTYKMAPAVDFEFQSFSVSEITWRLMGEYLLPFELTSVLLLVAIVGAVLIAKRN